MDLRKSDAFVELSNFNIYYIWRNIKKMHGSKFEISGPIWDEEFELHDGSSVSGILNYFESIIKKYETLTDNQ